MDWAKHGVKIVHSDELDLNTPQTSGMTRAAAITRARAGASKPWAGTMVVQPDAKTGPHHHGELETVLYVVKGRVRMRWGDQLEFSEEARPGDFIYVPPYVPHQEINASPDETCEAVVVRDGQDPIVVNLDLRTPEPASAGHGGMPFHLVVGYIGRVALARSPRRCPPECRAQEPIGRVRIAHRFATL